MPPLPRILAVMGSGETAPTMVSTHQELLSTLPDGASAVLIETPYGFQENADEISERAAGYFARNVGHPITPVGPRAGGRSSDTDPNDLARLQRADYVFAGPGSPTYALAQWHGSPFAESVADKLRTGGVVVFASAAAVGLGRVAIPVYEIYKVGQPPHWVEGLDLMSVAGIDAAVIPHFDNAEGGTHDTRFCYLGARRLHIMEQELDDDTFVIGVDEHTALILDLVARAATVRGRGQVTVRRAGTELRTVAAGARLPIAELTRAEGATPTDAAWPTPDAAVAAPAPDGDQTSRTLDEQARAATRTFDAALARGDGRAAAEVILDLEEAIAQWSADTTQSDEGDRARAALRGLVIRLGDAATEGLVDPTARLAPMIDVVVRAREELRTRRDYALADQLRDAADAVGIELRDGEEGTTWHMVTS